MSIKADHDLIMVLTVRRIVHLRLFSARALAR